MFILGLVLFILSVILLIKVCYDKKHLIETNTQTIEINKKIEEENQQKQRRKEELESEIQKIQTRMQTINEAMRASAMTAEEVSRNMSQALYAYVQNLDQQYQEREEEYDNSLQLLYASYNDKHDQILQELQQEQDSLDKVRNTRIAAIEAQLREKEISDNMSFYCLQPTEDEIDDIQVLERVKPKLRQPRILSMLIWSTYFQKPMTALCNNVLGVAIVSGIYKITNQETGECYIGQAVDVAKRWKDHAKCGLGIDTPANNKLYKAIQEYGIWNFSWELLEKCNKELLNEKENYYIELYDSKNYGYNSSIGIKKS